MVKANIQWTAKQITKMYGNNTLRFDNAIQRGIVWDIKRKSLLIDSLIKGYPVPPMYTIRIDGVKDEKGKVIPTYDCIDGKQRCSTIAAFRNGEFSLSLDDEELNGKTFTELSEDMQDSISDYSLTVYYFTDISEDEVAEMMSRLNNGKPLSGVENARIKSRSLAVIQELAAHDLFADNLSDAAKKSYVNEDMVVKTVMQMHNKEFELSSKNVRAAYENHTFKDEEISELNETFDKLAEVYEIIKAENKKVYKKITQKTNMVTIIYFTIANVISVNDLVKSLIHFFDINGQISISEEYNEVMSNGTNHRFNVMTRNEEMDKHF